MRIHTFIDGEPVSYEAMWPGPSAGPIGEWGYEELARTPCPEWLLARPEDTHGYGVEFFGSHTGVDNVEVNWLAELLGRWPDSEVDAVVGRVMEQFKHNHLGAALARAVGISEETLSIEGEGPRLGLPSPARYLPLEWSATVHESRNQHNFLVMCLDAGLGIHVQRVDDRDEDAPCRLKRRLIGMSSIVYSNSWAATKSPWPRYSRSSTGYLIPALERPSRVGVTSSATRS
ncbi:hypothetical protein [Nocardioides sp.]|uniref:hypothetical protein n=1 Tax=Nocardioides sp. TaxID=35761 RepID=UPI002C029AB1|nr:hypothetical protein [Nocardioides sp.]HSX67130.1 hypothetical protein [Nocardioides sp.]